MSDLVITVHARPAPQGSKLRTRFGLVDDNAKTLKPWRKAVTAAASLLGVQPLAGPVEVELTITVGRPRIHYRTGRNAHLLRDGAPTYPIGRGAGDIDKYARSCLDALTDAGIFADDVQVVELVARKTYPGAGVDALDRPGALIRVRRMATRAQQVPA